MTSPSVELERSMEPCPVLNASLTSGLFLWFGKLAASSTLS